MKPVVMILCGGRGTRLQERTQLVPKPLVEIGGRPIVWHVVNIYVAQGFTRFLLLTGYRREQIESFVAAEPWPAGIEIRCLATGDDTPTGGRVKLGAEALNGLRGLGAQARGELRGLRTEALERDGAEALDECCVTYADGVADVDLDATLTYHRRHGAAATMTVVRPRLQFGVAELNGDGVVSGFVEKPMSDQWVNGGFFCFGRAALEALSFDSVLEREPLEQLAAAGELRAFRHDGFWACMDTHKDAVELGDMWAQGRAPWKLWD